ncbi:MAG: hypothetical protein ABIK37_04690 [candidate division WOR-3 bacterium]
MKPLPPQDDDEARARQILKAMERLDRDRRPQRHGISPVWILVVLLVLAIVFVLAAGRERFALLWQHLLRPDSIPQQ